MFNSEVLRRGAAIWLVVMTLVIWVLAMIGLPVIPSVGVGVLAAGVLGACVLFDALKGGDDGDYTGGVACG